MRWLRGLHGALANEVGTAAQNESGDRLRGVWGQIPAMERTWRADKLGEVLPNRSPPWASLDACSFWKRLQPESPGDLESEHLTGRQRLLCAGEWAELGVQAHHVGSPYST